MAQETLQLLFEQYTGGRLDSISEISASGSHRRYFRMQGDGISIIGVIGTDVAENHAFITLDRLFRVRGINVPEVYAVSPDGLCYIQEDLGDELLFSAVARGRESGSYNEEEESLLLKTIACLPKIQFEGGRGLDWNICYPQPSFDARMIDFDLNYFKYCFLKATGLEFHEVKLQDDFERLREDLLQDDEPTFLYRDFQARNVMLKDGVPYFIDFQGGRKGPIYYDVASFISQARSRYPETLKQKMVATYLEALKPYKDIDPEAFNARLRLFILFRTLQVLGAYGFRGYFEKKPHFLASVPFALDNLRRLLKTPFDRYPYLNSILSELTTLSQFYSPVEDRRLEVHIWSFAFKKGVPPDDSGNGGGYVFDCRSVNNPGKYEFYRQFNGTDAEVIKFLEDDGEILTFLDSVYALVDAHVQRFIERKFSHLQVCFGCTGGQHRSVYSAEHLAAHLAAKFDVKIIVTHRELNIEKRI